MQVIINTLTDAQSEAIERIRIEECEFYNLTLDMPRINGGDASITGQPDWTDDPYYSCHWTVTATGHIRPI